MTVSGKSSIRPPAKKAPGRRLRPRVEGLEDRMLLYSAVGHWTYSSRITYSFMPDGTSIAGTPSNLFATLNAVTATASWQNAVEQAAAVWENNANLNLAQVGDSGDPFGTSGDQQDDPRFGDIRIGAMPMAQGVLAETFLPPPSNGGTASGDLVFNSAVQWAVGGVGYDLETVALHEFGHALGLADQSTDSQSAMYYSYNAIKTSLDSDDVAGIQSLYSAPQYDRFNSGSTKNSSPLTATNLTPYLTNNQIAVSGLENTTPIQSEYYSVTVPSAYTGPMVVTAQSSNLSSLAPTLMLLNSSWGIVAQTSAPTTYGATISLSASVTPGQTYYIKVASPTGYGRVGAYGLEVNFGGPTMPPIAPPNTMVPQQPSQGGGATNNAITPWSGHGGAVLFSTGSVETTTDGANGRAAPAPSTAVGVTTKPVGPSAATTTTSPTVITLIAPTPAPDPIRVRVPGRHRPRHHAEGAPPSGGAGRRGPSRAFANQPTHALDLKSFHLEA